MFIVSVGVYLCIGLVYCGYSYINLRFIIKNIIILNIVIKYIIFVAREQLVFNLKKMCYENFD